MKDYEKKEVNYIEYPIIGGKYEHYKGGLYEVISLGKYSVDDSTVVVYKSLLFGSLHVRPLSEWSDIVEQILPIKTNSGDLTNKTQHFKVKRFLLIN